MNVARVIFLLLVADVVTHEVRVWPHQDEDGVQLSGIYEDVTLISTEETGEQYLFVFVNVTADVQVIHVTWYETVDGEFCDSMFGVRYNGPRLGHARPDLYPPPHPSTPLASNQLDHVFNYGTDHLGEGMPPEENKPSQWCRTGYSDDGGCTLDYVVTLGGYAWLQFLSLTPDTACKFRIKLEFSRCPPGSVGPDDTISSGECYPNEILPPLPVVDYPWTISSGAAGERQFFQFETTPTNPGTLVMNIIADKYDLEVKARAGYPPTFYFFDSGVKSPTDAPGGLYAYTMQWYVPRKTTFNFISVFSPRGDVNFNLTVAWAGGVEECVPAAVPELGGMVLPKAGLGCQSVLWPPTMNAYNDLPGGPVMSPLVGRLVGVPHYFGPFTVAPRTPVMTFRATSTTAPVLLFVYHGSLPAGPINPVADALAGSCLSTTGQQLLPPNNVGWVGYPENGTYPFVTNFYLDEFDMWNGGDFYVLALPFESPPIVFNAETPLSLSFTHSGVLEQTSAEPRMLKTGSATSVTISGSGFTDSPGLACSWAGGTTTTSATFVNFDRVTCPSPIRVAGDTGASDVSVVWSGQAALGTPIAVAYFDDPTVESLVPSDIFSGGGADITITGTGFIADGTPQCVFTVVLTSDPITTEAVRISDTELRCRPPMLPSNEDVTLKVSLNGLDVTATQLVARSYALPVVSAVEPTHAPRSSQTAITIRGSGFLSGSGQLCRFGWFVSPATLLSPTELSCKLPAVNWTRDVNLTTRATPVMTGDMDEAPSHPYDVMDFTKFAIRSDVDWEEAEVIRHTGHASQELIYMQSTLRKWNGESQQRLEDDRGEDWRDARAFEMRASTQQSQERGGEAQRHLLAHVQSVAIPVELSPNGVDFFDTGVIVTAYPDPSISGIGPSKGPEGGGTTVTLTGDHFPANTGIADVRIGGITLPAEVVNAQTLKFVTPEGTDTATIEVSFNRVDWTPSPQGFEFTADKTLIIVLAVLGCFVFLLVVIIAVLAVLLQKKKRRRRRPVKYAAGDGDTVVVGQDEMSMNILVEDLLEDAKLIGQGLCADVFVADLDGEMVAIKVLRSDSQKEAQEFHKEVTVLGKLLCEENPYIITIKFFADNPHAIAMEYCEKGPLDEYLAANPDLTHEQRWKLTKDVASGMWFLCSMSLYHRDLKTKNLLLANDGNVRITDFGCCVGKNIETFGLNWDDFAGTPAYAAPERFAKTPHNLELSEVYSFAVCAWAIFAGQEPFVGMDATAIMRQAQTNPNLRPLLGEEWKAEVTKLMTEAWPANPLHRPTFDEICRYMEEPDLEKFIHDPAVNSTSMWSHVSVSGQHSFAQSQRSLGQSQRSMDGQTVEIQSSDAAMTNATAAQSSQGSAAFVSAGAGPPPSLP